MKYETFRDTITKKNCPKKAKISNSWGVYDAYKHIRKHQWYDIGRPLKEHEFYTIIRKVNNLLAKELAQGNPVIFPFRMGILELRKRPAGVSIVDGALKNTYPIDWDSTLRLWFEDEEAKKDKTLLRHEAPNVYYIKYNKFKANYENQCFYEFQLNRFVKLALKENIKKGKIDALW